MFFLRIYISIKSFLVNKKSKKLLIFNEYYKKATINTELVNIIKHKQKSKYRNFKKSKGLY